MVDHFTKQADAYAAFRPNYPSAIFEYVQSVAPKLDLCWDVGAGSGQASIPLAERFARVVATDASAAQLAHAPAHPRIEYRVGGAEASGLPDASADAVTVAQALHWFTFDAFYAEVRRVLVRDGVIVAWTYADPVLDDPALDAILKRYNRETVGAYWPVERQYVRDEYRTVPFPFVEMATPAITLEREWTLRELAGYVRSWSATARYTSERGLDPVLAFEAAMGDAWGGAEVRQTIRWPLTIRSGRTRVT